MILMIYVQCIYFVSKLIENVERYEAKQKLKIENLLLQYWKRYNTFVKIEKMFNKNKNKKLNFYKRERVYLKLEIIRIYSIYVYRCVRTSQDI